MYMIIDAHTHAFPDFLAEKAVNQLVEMAYDTALPCYNGTVAGLLESMDRGGVDCSVICSIATAPGQTENIINWSSELNNPRLIPLASVHPDNTGIPALMERISAAGLKGIKLHPMFQKCPLDDDRLTPVFETACSLGLRIALHMGYDLAFPADESASPQRLEKILDTYPDLQCFAAHYGGFRNWEEVYNRLAGRDVYLGTSFTFEYIETDLFQRIADKHGIERIMFGTDSPWQDPINQIRHIENAGFSDREQAAVLGSNAAAFYNLSI